MRNRHLKWYRLDNAAKIFPSIMTRRMTAVFRVSATLTEEVDPAVLQQALEDILPRFPYYRVTLKRGMFWHYLQETTAMPRVSAERFDPCRKISRRHDRGLYFRVLHFKKMISVEFCHVLTDGTGGVVFLRSLVYRYLGLRGIDLPPADGIFTAEEEALAEEDEDAYMRYHKGAVPFPPREPRAFHLPGGLIYPDSLNVCTGIVSAGDLLERARAGGLTVTEYIAALYIFSLQQYLLSLPPAMRRKLLRPIRIMVPVNLRKLYSSRTMRNFFLTVKPGIDPRLGQYTLDQVKKSVYHSMRVDVDEKFINQQIARNIRGQSSALLRALPLFVKGPVMRLIYNRGATAKHSGVVTNMGVIDLPPEVARMWSALKASPIPIRSPGSIWPY
jgi:hypothetical protein